MSAKEHAGRVIPLLSDDDARSLESIAIKEINGAEESVRYVAEEIRLLVATRFETAFYDNVKDQIISENFAQAYAFIAGANSPYKTFAWYELGRALVRNQMFTTAERCLEAMDESRIETHCLRCLWEHAQAFHVEKPDYLWVRTQVEATIGIFTDTDFDRIPKDSFVDRFTPTRPVIDRVIEKCSEDEIKAICSRARKPDGFFRPQNLVGEFIATALEVKLIARNETVRKAHRGDVLGNQELILVKQAEIQDLRERFRAEELGSKNERELIRQILDAEAKLTRLNACVQRRASQSSQLQRVNLV
ncbi:MAG: hypothetical protein H7A36_04485 [Chlamydiales bacterium]|nr:hypothetical protein [Chlamydiales bacterium]